MTSVAAEAGGGIGQRLLLDQVARARGRLRAQEALRAATLALTIACWVLAPLVLADRLLGLGRLGINVWLIWLLLLFLGLPFVLWRVFSSRLSLRSAAGLADERLKLHARLSTALTLEADEPSGFGRAFLGEAVARAANVELAGAFPLSLPRLACLLPLPLVIALGLWFFVEPQDYMGWVARAQKERRFEEVRKKSVEKLRDLKLEDLKRDGKEPPPDSPQFKVNRLIQKSKELARQIQDGKLDQEEGLKALAELKRDIQKTREEMEKGTDWTERLQQLKAADLNLGEDSMTRQVSEALKAGDAGLAARSLRRLADKLRKDILDNPNLTREQKASALKRLREEVARLAGAVADAQALSGSLQELADKLDDAAEYAALQDQIKEMLAKTGKQTPEELARQLEQAMAEAAEELEQLEEGEEGEALELTEEDEALEELEVAIDEVLDGMCEGGGAPGSGGMKGRARGLAGKAGKGPKGFSLKAARGKRPGPQRGAGTPGVGMDGGPGVGKRPFAEDDVAFKGTKVQGKMQSGAITSLSHFRGEGAKGEAPQEYVETLAASEREAASSLEIDRIPADAREMVKEYFSRLKTDASK